MENNNSEGKEIELALPLMNIEDDNYVSKGGAKGSLSFFSASVNEITNWFKSYQVESIEIWISGVIESEGIIKLIVSAKGEGGMKVLLKPK